MNQRNPILLVLICFLVTICTAVQAQDRETRDVSTFNGIKLGVPGNLHLKQGAKQEVVIEASDDILDRIETEVKDGYLVIKQENDWNWKWWKSNTGRIDIYITATDIEYLAVSGSGTMEGENTIKADDLGLDISGSGNMDLDIQANDIESRISGSGNMELSGSCTSNDIRISGSGDLRADNLAADLYSIQISGSGTCRIYAKSEIDARVTGSGNIYYKGEPDKVHSSISGSGSLKKM